MFFTSFFFNLKYSQSRVHSFDLVQTDISSSLFVIYFFLLRHGLSSVVQGNTKVMLLYVGLLSTGIRDGGRSVCFLSESVNKILFSAFVVKCYLSMDKIHSFWLRLVLNSGFCGCPTSE